MHLRNGLLLILALGGCASTAPSREWRFTRGVLAQEVGDETSAFEEYLAIVQAGEATSAVYNNLAVITAHRRRLPEARNWLACALAADPDDVIARANYGVVQYHLGALAEAREALSEARLRRREILAQSSFGRVSWSRYAEYTDHADEVAARYLERLDRPGAVGVVPDGPGVLAWLIAE